MNQSMLNTLKRFAIPLGLALVAIVGLVIYATQTTTKKQVTELPAVATVKSALSVTTVQPKQNSMAVTVPATGNIAAWQEASVGAEISGLLLKEVLVNVGDTVKKGQVLARFSNATVEADMAQAEANLADAKATALEATNNAERARSIQGTGALSAQQTTQYLATEASAKARVEAAEASLKVQQVKLRQTVVLAPDNGLISSRTATVGAVASAGQELFKLIRQSRLEWRAELTSALVNQVKIGMPAVLTLPDGRIARGKVRAFAPTVDTQTRNAIVYVDLTSPDVKAGMYARGQFTLEDSPALTLPNSAVVMRDGFAYVMQLMPDQSVMQVKVALGRRTGEDVEVLNLKGTEAQYVNSGGAFLVDGDKVKVVNPVMTQLK